MSLPKITIWKNPVWPKLTPDPYDPSPERAPIRETDEEGGRRLLFCGEEVLALSSGGITLNRHGSMLVYFTLGDRRHKSFIARGGRDEIEWLRDSLGPKENPR